jgi:hypothetical protein
MAVINSATYGVGVYGTAKYGQFIVSVDGVSTTGQVSAVNISNSFAITGVSANASVRPIGVGQFEIDIFEIVESVSATGSAGTVTFKNDSLIVPTGAQGTTTVNAIGVGASPSVTGVAATSSVNTVQENVSEGLTGVSATGFINDAWNIRSINRVPVFGASATGFVGLQVNVSEFINSVSANTATNTVTVNNTKPISAPAITGSVSGLSVGQFEVDVSEVIPTGVSGTTQVTAVQPNITEKITGVAATGAVEDLSVGGFEVDVVEVLNSAVGTFASPAVQINVSEKVVSVSASGAVRIVQPNITEKLASVSATASTKNLAVSVFEVDVSEALASVAANVQTGGVQPNITEKVSGVSATGAISGLSFGVFEVDVSEALVNVVGTTAVTAPTATGVTFDFNAVKDQYSTQRTIIMFPASRNLTAQQRTAYVA